MATIITRETGATAKGSPLTNAEVDANFINLNTEVSPSRPSIRPTFNVDFANLEDIDSNMFISRNSAATTYDESGKLITIRDGKSRPIFNPETKEAIGILVEEQKTNIILASESFNLGSLYNRTNVAFTDPVIESPAKTAVQKLTENTLTGQHLFYQIITIEASTVYTYSAYFKAAEWTSVQIQMGSGGPTATFNLTSKTATADVGALKAKIETVANGWFRCSVTGIPSNGTFYVYKTSARYLGDGTSGIYVWGLQAELGYYATSYIPTYPVFTSRGSNATYFDSSGVLKFADSEQDRQGYLYSSSLDSWVYYGSLLENSSTNLYANCLVSNTTWYAYGSSSFVPNYALGPDNSYSATLINLTNNSGPLQEISENKTTGITYTTSTYIKLLSGSGTVKFGFGWEPTSNNDRVAYFDLNTGVITEVDAGLTASIQKLQNGWFRLTATVTKTDSRYGIGSLLYGVGTTAVLQFGWQLEVGSSATSLIFTRGSQASRSADYFSTASVTRADELISFNQSFASKNAGTYYLEFGSNVPHTYSNAWVGNLLTDNAGDSAGFRLIVWKDFIEAFTNQWTSDVNNHLTFPNNKIKVAFTFEDKVGSALCVNSSAIIPQTSVDTKVYTNKLYIGGSSPTSFVIKKISYYPKRLADSELLALTK